MWTLKFRLHNKKAIINKLCNKYNLNISGYPLNYFEENNKIYLNAAGIISGSKNDKTKAIKELKKAKEIRNLEVNNDFVIICIEQPKETSIVYSNEFIHIEPIQISNNFFQDYHLGSFDREKLNKIMNINIPNVKFELKKIKKEKIKDITITKTSPTLTDKQFDSFRLAYGNGYYNFPRDGDLNSLSKLMKVSISTYQAHLRKAEKKIMDFFYKYTK